LHQSRPLLAEGAQDEGLPVFESLARQSLLQWRQIVREALRQLLKR
jgi:hypothetical protein